MKAVISGIKQTEAAVIFGVSRSTVNIWVNNYKRKGKSSLTSKKRGVSKERKLKGHQAATIVNIIKDRHLIKFSKGKKVFLIVDNLSTHKSKKVLEFIDNNKKKIQLFYLRTYSPDLNPDELLNNDLKSILFKTRRPESKQEQTLLSSN